MEHLLEKILLLALKQRVTDIHITQRNKEIVIQFRIKGALNHYSNYDSETGNRFINYIKFLANIDLNHRLTPHTGHFEYTLQQSHYSFRVSSIPTINGDHLVIRILHHGQLLTLKQLTRHHKAHQFLNQLTQLKSGLIIICGPTGEGKSTTLHALLHSINMQGRVNVITIEDPIEIIEPGYIQIQINFEAGINFEEALKQILRHDPDVVMIGEIRDEISAALAIRCALTGCLVLSTLHSKNCIGGIKRLKNLHIDELDLFDTLQAIISQRLIHTDTTSFAVYEWLEEKEIEYYLSNKSFIYKDFIDYIEESIQKQETSKTDYELSEFKTKLFTN